jgi:hypothetical protein
LRAREDFNTNVDKFVEIRASMQANSPFFNRVHRFALFWGKAETFSDKRDKITVRRDAAEKILAKSRR